MTYVERLRVPSWWWLVAALLVASVAMAILAYVPWQQGVVIVGLFGLAVAVVVFSYGHTAVSVVDGVLHVGRYTLEGRWIAGVEPLDRDESAHAMAAGANPRDFLVTRPYITDLVRIRLNDAADPHPHWLISSRRPQEFAAAVEAISVGSA
ncbi:DUF3093 domain-containing protein [Tessaracoccus antarcticus]|uniref:DUF3093 domain-containing protein n=1 Tax=Tessaracoccus antarcticus TaxID=2479848 RepID=A0A3M0G5D2_9ACTN|nr:DUF3093 domain-containing protein [Tessaracoccus antarcticus]RMB60085.1 DUF3093 domain-containing protein [Tessaracoccus antarcticus]